MTNFSQPMLRATASRSLFSVESADAPNWAPKLSAENELAAALDTGGGGRRQRASVSAALQMRNMAFGQPAPVLAACQATWQPLSSGAEPQPRSPRLAAFIEPQAFDELTRQGGELAVGGVGGQRRELEPFEPRRELLASGHALALQDLEAAVLDTVGRGAADRVGRQRSEAW